MSHARIVAAKQRLIAAGLAVSDTVRGCSEKEIAQLEADTCRPLPPAYRDFLSELGQSAGEFLRGTNWTYAELRALQVPAVQLLKSGNEQAVLPANSFVFAMHQGYQFLYFLTVNMDNDPPVFYYTEDPDLESLMPQRKFEHLSEFLTIFIADARNRHAQEAFLARWKRKAATNPT